MDYKFRCRCSSIGTLMSGSFGLTESQELKLEKYLKRKRDFKHKVKGVKNLPPTYREECFKLIDKKRNPLPQGTKTLLLNWKRDKIYDRSKFFVSKYTDKGNLVEDDSIDFLVDALDWDFDTVKNEDYFKNEYIHGTPDIILKNLLPDVKNSYDHTTFPLWANDIKDYNIDYWWQCQGYMWLTGKKKGAIYVVLMDMPDELLEKEVNKVYYSAGNTLTFDEIEFKLRQFYTYSDLPIELRLKKFEFDYDSLAIEQIKERIEEGRRFLKKYDIPVFKSLESKKVA